MRTTMLSMLMAIAVIISTPPDTHAHVIKLHNEARAAKVQAKRCIEGMYTVKEYRLYADRVYKRDTISKQARKRMTRMHVCQSSWEDRLRVSRRHEKLKKARTARARPVITALMDCIMRHESTYNPLAQNGKYKGLAQWSPEAWARHGGLKYGPTPHDATYWEQVRVLSDGLRMYGCRDWCPFDPC
jgi:hypothetical protein